MVAQPRLREGVSRCQHHQSSQQEGRQRTHNRLMINYSSTSPIIQVPMVKILHVRLEGVEILHGNGIEEAYYSLTHEDKQYFSSTFDHQNTRLQDDLLLKLENGIPDSLSLQRWQNSMIVFSFDLQLPELRTRGIVRRKIETRQLEILSLSFSIYEEKEVLFSDKYLESISQHYLIIEDIAFVGQPGTTRAAASANYFTVTTQNSQFMIPVRGGHVLVRLPETIEIASFVNNCFAGKSAVYGCDQLKNGMEVDLNKTGKGGRVSLRLRWAINLHKNQAEQNLLMQVNELLFYDVQLKFENIGEVTGCKLKIMHGSKAFDFTQDIDHSRITRIRKIVHFVIKSEQEEVDLVLHRNGKTFSFARINTAELQSYALTTIKKKWPDPNNPSKFYGYIKIKGERAKNVSIPQSNRYWREALKRRQTITSIMVGIEQPSVYYSSQQSLALSVKVQNEQKIVKSLCNLNFYSDAEPTSEVVEFGLKGQDSVYLIVKEDPRNPDYLGIGVVNTIDLRLGLNVCEVGFFKNQQKIGTVNCIINKLAFWPFLKPLFQSQATPQQLLATHVDLFFNKISFSPYYYTYQYDNKQQVYCIAQINKVKKVLILENTQHDSLSFCTAAGSDQLTYGVEHPDTMKIKLTFLVSDLGHEEEIYGVATAKIRGEELEQKEIKLKNVEICNEFSVNLGYVNIEISKGNPPKLTPHIPPTEVEKKSIGSFDLSQASFDTQLNQKPNKSPSRRYSGGYINSAKPKIHDFMKKNPLPPKHLNPARQVKLPVIKERKDKDTFKDLLMKVRKRGQGGRYQLDGGPSKLQDKEVRRQRHSFDLKKIEQSNPNLNRNLEILFPKKGNEKQIQMTRSKQNDYEDRLRGLKSVMNEIEDIGEVEPSIRESNEVREPEYDHYEPTNDPTYEAEWQGNEFAMP